MMTDHASDEYLSGLSELDAARAVIAVRWCGARWVLTDADKYTGRKLFVGKHVPLQPNRPYEFAEPDRPISAPRWLEYQSTIWGATWYGTASLMELAESQGWSLSSLECVDDEFHLPEPIVMLSHHVSGIDVEESGATIHEAVLLACARAAQQMEAKNGD